MKILFAHDHRFYEKNDSLYSEVEFGYGMWQRYLKVFDEVTIAARISKICDDKDTSKMNLASGEGVSYVAVPSISGIKKNISNHKDAMKILKEKIENIDGVVARLPSEIGLLAVKICKELNKPFLIELVGCPKDAYYYQGSIAGKLYSPIITERTKKAVASSEFVLYVTKDYLQKRYPNINVTINCSNVEIESENTAPNKNKKRFSQKEVFKIGLIGSLATSYKGIDVALHALKYLEKYNVELFIVGKGNTEKWIQLSKNLNVNKRVHFVGTMKSGSSILKWLDTMDLYIQPSKTEGLPRALVEAMSRKLPALGSNVGGIPELLDEDFLHTSGDYKKMAEQIAFFIENPQTLEDEANKNFIKSKEYTKEILDRKRTDLFKSFRSHILERGEAKNV